MDLCIPMGEIEEIGEISFFCFLASSNDVQRDTINAG